MKDRTLKHRKEWTPERFQALTVSSAIALFGSVFLGLFAVKVGFYYVAAVAIGSLLALVIAWQFESVLFIYALVAFVPWGRTPDIAIGGSGMGKGLYISELMLGSLLVVWFGKYILGLLPKNRIRCGFYVPIALYMAYCCLNLWNSFIFWDSHVSRIYQHPLVNVVEIGLHILSAGALVMMATSIGSRKWLNRVTVALLVAGAYSCLNGLFGLSIPLQAHWAPLLTYLPAGYALAVAIDRDKSRTVRSLAALGVALTVWLVFFQGISWVTGWLGLFVTFGVVILIWDRKMFVIALVVVSIVGIAGWSFLEHNVVKQSVEEQDFNRIPLLVGAVRYAVTFPLGVGLGNYRSYNSYYYGEKWGTMSYTSAHGTYAQHLSETGIPGLLLFLGILVCGFRWMLRSYQEMPRGPSKTFLLVAMGQLVGIAVTSMIGDYIIPTYHNGGIFTFSTTVYSWLIWGLAVAHVRFAGASEVE